MSFHYRFHFLLDRYDRAIWRCEAMEMSEKLNERGLGGGEERRFPLALGPPITLALK